MGNGGHPASSGYLMSNLRKESHEGWKNLISAVQEKGSTIFCQLWHVGGLKTWSTSNPEVPGYTPSGLVRKDKELEMTEMMLDHTELCKGYRNY